MRIVCQQTILMKYHALFVIFEKAAKFSIVVCFKGQMIHSLKNITIYALDFRKPHFGWDHPAHLRSLCYLQIRKEYSQTCYMENAE